MFVCEWTTDTVRWRNRFDVTGESSWIIGGRMNSSWSHRFSILRAVCHKPKIETSKNIKYISKMYNQKRFFPVSQANWIVRGKISSSCWNIIQFSIPFSEWTVTYVGRHQKSKFLQTLLFYCCIFYGQPENENRMHKIKSCVRLLFRGKILETVLEELKSIVFIWNTVRYKQKDPLSDKRWSFWMSEIFKNWLRQVQ